MPIYRYKCITETDRQKHHRDIVGTPTCDHEYEVFYTSVTKAELEEPDEPCPKCGGKEKERLISTGTSHILKGKGWYRDGY